MGIHSYPCPVNGCRVRRKQQWHVTCAACWRRVPFKTQQRLYQQQYAEKTKSRGYELSCRLIVDILNNNGLMEEGQQWP